MNPILPIAGVSDELLRVLNDRFRQLEGTAPAATPVATPAPAPARDLGTPVQGADVLVDINRIPKVATVGRLTESCITDDGAQVSIDEGATPQNSQLVVRAAGQGAMSVLAYGADNQVIGVDVEFTAGNWIAKHPVVLLIYKRFNGFLHFLGSVGNTVGVLPIFNNLVGLNIATGALGCGGNTSPAYPLDVTGDINTSTGYRMAGNAGLSPAGFTIVSLAKLTSGGVGGSITIRGGIVTNYIAPT
jgi:hypothetical protein